MRYTENLHEFASALGRGRLLGLDLGDKTIGLALSDSARGVATPLETLARKKFSQDAATLLSVVGAHDICGLICGLPLNMDGSTGTRAQITRAFASNMIRMEEFDLPFLLWDERLSTRAATHTLLAADMSRIRRSEVIDKVAAAYILQGALDALKNACREGKNL